MRQKYLVVFLLVALALVDGKKKGRKRPGARRRPAKLRRVAELDQGKAAVCPGKYIFEDGDEMILGSPKYPKLYPNNYNCRWSLQASGCQFNIACEDMYTKPACSGGYWRPEPKCEGDYLRFYSASLTEAREERFDERFCATNRANFTFGFSDNLIVQFKTDGRYRARGFNCTVKCEPFDFSLLFARIPLSPFIFEKNPITEELNNDENDEDYDEDEENIDEEEENIDEEEDQDDEEDEYTDDEDGGSSQTTISEPQDVPLIAVSEPPREVTTPETPLIAVSEPPREVTTPKTPLIAVSEPPREISTPKTDKHIDPVD